MVEAIAREAQRVGSFREFLQDARDAEDEVLRTEKAYDAEEVFAYLAAKAQSSGAIARHPLIGRLVDSHRRELGAS
jgi:hypothetical protein